MDVIFVETNTAALYQDLAKDYSAIETPTWSLLLAESCRSKGYLVDILDANAERLSDEQTLERIVASKASLVCFVVYGQNPNSGTTNMTSAVRVAARLKDHAPELKNLFIGSHVSALPKEILMYEYVDFVSVNEGVYTLHDILATNKKDELDKVRGLGYKKDGTILFGRTPELVPQSRLDIDLPGYAWDLLPYHESPFDMYRAHFWHANYSHESRTPFAAIYSSLGCNFQCSFCMINIVNRTTYDDDIHAGNSRGMRHWSREFIKKEIKKLSDFGVRNIRLSDEMFFLNKKYYEPIVDDLCEMDLDLNLWSYSRVDTVNLSMIKKIKKAGFQWIGMGIESGNQTVRQEVSKGSFKVVNIKELLDEVRANDVRIGANYIFGFPQDTFETMNDTLEMAKDINAEFSNVYPCMALPGSPIYYEAIQNKWALPQHFPEYGFLSYECNPLPTNYLSSKEVLRFRDEAWLKLNRRRSYLDMIENTFGSEARNNIMSQSNIKLRRKILGD